MKRPELPRTPAGLLGALTLAGLGMVSLVDLATRHAIAENRRAVLLREIEELVPVGSFDNDLLADRVDVKDDRRVGSPMVTVYRARKAGQSVAAVLAPVAPNGYSGLIRLLAAVRPDGTLAGVRVLEHRETPGLGDAIEAGKSDWLRQFDGRSLTDPPAARWQVRRDGGDFDQLTGATITPRAVVGTVRQTLEFVQARRDRLFAAPAGSVIED